MSVTIVFGGQYGDEGKGKTAHFFAVKEKAKYCVRVGSSNSDHTVYRGDEKIIFHILPTGVIEKSVTAVLPAGSYIDLEALWEDMRAGGVTDDRLLIDENAVVLSAEDRQAEVESNLQKRIGSTNSGTGAAVAKRLSRQSDKILAKNCEKLKKYICDTKSILRNACTKGEKIIIEGTQGYGLSLLHAKDYPYTTSRDTSAAGALSETGLSPFDVENIVMVIRVLPIRVAGESGPLKNEITWDILKEELGCSQEIAEYTSCTKLLKRVARFDADIVKRSILCNKPNIVVVNHLDLLPNNNAKRKMLIKEFRENIGMDIDYIGIDGKSLLEVIE